MKIHDLSDLKQMHAIVTLEDERTIDGLQVKMSVMWGWVWGGGGGGGVGVWVWGWCGGGVGEVWGRCGGGVGVEVMWGWV